MDDATFRVLTAFFDPRPRPKGHSAPDAILRSISPVCSGCGSMELSFEIAVAGQAAPLVVRLSLSAAGASAMATGAMLSLFGSGSGGAQCHRCTDHSDKSCGNPIADESGAQHV